AILANTIAFWLAVRWRRPAAERERQDRAPALTPTPSRGVVGWDGKGAGGMRSLPRPHATVRTPNLASGFPRTAHVPVRASPFGRPWPIPGAALAGTGAPGGRTHPRRRSRSYATFFAFMTTLSQPSGTSYADGGLVGPI